MKNGGVEMADIEKLWGYACSGNTEALRKYYDEGGSVNNRYFMFGESHSLLMGAFRNNHLDTVEYLLSEGEELTKKEYEEFKSDMRKQELMERMVEQSEQELGMNQTQSM